MREASQSAGGWDVHTHIIPPAVIAAAERDGYGMRIAPEALHICGHGVPLHPLSDLGKLFDRLHADGLDGAIVSVPPPLFRPDLSVSDRRGYANLVNDGLLAACHSHPNALRPFAYLPAEDPELSADIAAKLDGNWAGVVMGTDLGDSSYAAAAFDSLWQVLSDLRLPLFIHPGSTPDKRLDPFYLTNLLGNPIETTIAASNLIFGGVMHRFPSLKIILAHGGGCTAALCGRWQRGAVTRRPGVPDMPVLPLDAARRFYVDSLVHSPAYLAAVAATFGEDHILLGSDWPFPMGAPSADHDLAHVGEDLRNRIRKANAEAAFGSRLRPQSIHARSS